MLAVRTADNRLATNLHSVCNQDALYHCSLFHNCSRHKNAVNHFCALSNLCSGKQHRILYFTLYDTALGDKCAFYICILRNVLRKRRNILRINLPCTVVQIQTVLLVQKIHVRFPQRIDGSYILPVTLEFIGKQSFSVIQKRRNNILAEIMVGFFVLHICNQHLTEQLPVKNIDAHGCKIALRLCRLLFKLHDTPGFRVRIHDAEAARFFYRHLDYRDGCIRVIIFMGLKHL